LLRYIHLAPYASSELSHAGSDGRRPGIVDVRVDGVSREQNDHPLVPRSVTTARTGCHGGLSEFVPGGRGGRSNCSRAHTQQEIPPDQVLALWCRPLMAPRRLQSVDTCMPTSAPTPPECLPLRTITALQTRRNRRYARQGNRPSCRPSPRPNGRYAHAVRLSIHWLASTSGVDRDVGQGQGRLEQGPEAV
jgi:hypothetical protein